MISLSRNRDNISYDQVLEKIKTYIEDENELKVINDSYELARSKHEGQYRKTGEAYIIHPLNVALILTEIYADYEKASEITTKKQTLQEQLDACMAEWEERRLSMGKAIGTCYAILTQYQRIMMRLRIPDEKYTLDIENIMRMINSLKAWRKSDNRLKSSLEKKQV